MPDRPGDTPSFPPRERPGDTPPSSPRDSSARTVRGGRRAGALAALVLLPGCLVLARTTTGNPLPAPEAVAAVQPGSTTRAQVIALLGAPDEYRQPGLAASVPVADSQAIRVLEEHDLFGRGSFTWARAQRGDRAWLLWPLFTHLRTDTLVDRLTVLFDEHDVVEAVGVERGIESP